DAIPSAPDQLGRMAGLSPAMTGCLPEAFRQFLSFLQSEVPASDIAALAAHGQITPHDLRIELAGPVGEQNTYRLTPRGDVLCVATARAAAMRQIAAALATGNRALVCCTEDFPELDRLPDPLRHSIVPCKPGTPPAAAAALFDGTPDALLRLNAQLAIRDGPIVPVFVASAGRYPLEFLLMEQAISINTAAAGGNASLMMIG
ncbi:MAG TPA: trifunctional transcriptional regulator/proline dehydrogenase/L-glutamate gamma-semialdehyde dehydrogenase, partial [Acetobacteraceae bacterium]|nr:trifunctional transcriptional regulator/proline dehydrogenase/L-glutamate gamma-semialdehyde dehydrogenase [Acetobacteraceae bacterium]